MADDRPNELSGKTGLGCALIAASFPAALIWYVLFGLMLNRYGAGAMEWSLYVGYLICSLLAFCLGACHKLME